MNDPIMEFKSHAEALESLKEWKERLGLTDWIIRLDLCEPSELELKDVAAECDYRKIIKTAVIRILLPKYCRGRIAKHCAEQHLVHELLHCKFAMMETDNEGLNTLIHQAIEDMAVALIMAKYNVTRDYFCNIDYSDYEEGKGDEGQEQRDEQNDQEKRP